MSVPSAAWATRRARATDLADRHPTAQELLRVYAAVLAHQADVAREAETWLLARPGVLAPRAGGPVVDVARVGDTPPPEAFVGFVRTIGPDATPVLAAAAEELAGAPDVAAELLAVFARGERLDAPAEVFFPRAFLQPVVEAAVSRVRASGHGATPIGAPAGGAATPGAVACPWCGGAPQVAVLVDDDAARGRRLLTCGLCQAEWTVPRAACPHCGESDSESRPYHEADAWPHVRIEECRTCRTYLKAVDLRKDGRAVPVIDEVATVELDLWAGEQGLRKLQANLLGL